jgi:hypothetical protein
MSCRPRTCQGGLQPVRGEDVAIHREFDLTVAGGKVPGAVDHRCGAKAAFCIGAPHHRADFVATGSGSLDGCHESDAVIECPTGREGRHPRHWRNDRKGGGDVATNLEVARTSTGGHLELPQGAGTQITGGQFSLDPPGVVAQAGQRCGEGGAIGRHQRAGDGVGSDVVGADQRDRGGGRVTREVGEGRGLGLELEAAFGFEHRHDPAAVRGFGAQGGSAAHVCDDADGGRSFDEGCAGGLHGGGVDQALEAVVGRDLPAAGGRETDGGRIHGGGGVRGVESEDRPGSGQR